MQMISDLRESFIANLDNLDWMDTKTKKYAKEKVLPSEIVINIIESFASFCFILRPE